jgi:hypothetical protein
MAIADNEGGIDMKLWKFVAAMTMIFVLVAVQVPFIKASTITVGDTSVSLTAYNNIFISNMRLTTPSPPHLVHIHSQWVAQTFLAPSTGTFNSVTLAIYKTGTPTYCSEPVKNVTSTALIWVSITKMAGNNGPAYTPNAPDVLGTVEVSANSIPKSPGTWMTFNFPASISVTKWTVYAICVRSNADMDRIYYNNGIRWQTDGSNSYSGGTVWYVNYYGTDTPVWTSTTYDMPFSLTITY